MGRRFRRDRLDFRRPPARRRALGRAARDVFWLSSFYGTGSGGTLQGRARQRVCARNLAFLPRRVLGDPSLARGKTLEVLRL